MVPMVTVSSVGYLSARGVSIGETDRTMSEEETVNSREQQQGATQEADPGSQEKVDLVLLAADKSICVRAYVRGFPPAVHVHLLPDPTLGGCE